MNNTDGQAGEYVDALFTEIDAFQNGTHDKMVLTGLVELDNLLGGLRPGWLVTVGAYARHGRLALGLGVARSCAFRQSKKCLVVSANKHKSVIARRMLMAEASIRDDEIASKEQLKPVQQARVDRVRRGGSDRFVVFDELGAGVDEIRSVAEQEHAKGELSLLVVDYLRVVADYSNRGTDADAVSTACVQLKWLARDLGVPVVVLHDLYREPEVRRDLTRDLLSRLRASGEVEAHSDVVVLIDPSTHGEPGVAKLMVTKNRHGRTGSVPVVYQPQFSRFLDMPEGLNR